jgi:hypothetical protein
MLHEVRPYISTTPYKRALYTELDSSLDLKSLIPTIGS